ncbi:helix-turn-helix domain-containing protein [Actinocrispum wychmicini]|uniref:Helix-turn-helix protein n=1 Tax=Actinocrispum wychmicini TaxID=1213861 RepID=A0A4R2IH59_9PSEU|nr:helix-turn-helix domain-containing protein [Actinocrispum wychmicini]TCO43807.1 hypothetical protein EV192_12622 [Actinocrispum wychmicini]
MTSPTNDIDPLDANTVAEFAECLRAVRLRAGNPSYRTLQQWGERNKIPLPRSTVQDALAGRRLPRKSLVLALVRACGIPDSDRRWEIAWTRLADHPTTPARPLTQLQQDLTRDFADAGLLRIGSTYLGEMEWKQLFAEVTELDIVVAYGQTWRNMHARELTLVAARPDRRIRVFLADPDDELTVTVLADRFSATHDELRSRITATRRAYETLRRPNGAQIEVYYRPGDRVFSFYRFDDVAVAGLYSHSRTRGAAVPVFVCARPGELYEFIQDELAVILDQSRLT